MSISLKKTLFLFFLVVFAGWTIKRFMFNPMSLLQAHLPPPPMVEAVPVQKKSIPLSLNGVGSLKARHEITLSSEVAGRIEEIHVASGAHVSKGDPILALNDDLERAQLAKAQAALELARVTLDRSRRLVSRSVEAQAALDQKKADYNQALANTVFAKAQLKKRKIVAPFSGEVGILQDPISVGHYIQPGEHIVTLTQRDPMMVNFSLSEKDRPKLAPGQVLSLTVDAHGDKAFEGKLTSIDPQILNATRTVNLQGEIPNKEGLLFPGMFARIKVRIMEKPQSVVIPETAIKETLYGSWVYVVMQNPKGEGQVAQRKIVKVGERMPGTVEITQGLETGDLVVAVGSEKLSDGAVVRLDTKAGLETPKKIARE